MKIRNENRNRAARRHTGRLAVSVLIAQMAAQTPVVAATLYVWLGSGNPLPPYTTWATAATNIQDAIDAAADGDQVVVTNGIYRSNGGRLVEGGNPTRVAVTNRLTVRS